MDKEEAEKFERRSTLFLLIINILLTTVGGYYFVGKYEAENAISNSQLSTIQSELAKIELETKATEKLLNVLSNRLEVSSETLKLAHDIIPKFNLEYLPTESVSRGESHVIAHQLHNVGGFSSAVEKYEAYLTSQPSSEYPPPEEILIDNRYYELEFSSYYSGLLASRTGKPYIIKLKTKQGINHKELYVHVFIHVSTHSVLTKLLSRSSSDLFTTELLRQLTNDRMRSSTKLEIK